VTTKRQFLDLVNHERTLRGLSPLTLSTNSRGVARDWSQQMAAGVGLKHRSPLSEPFTGRWTRLGENVGYGGTVTACTRPSWTPPATATTC
jgi:uncharacterized protein YkwD